jgi:hypothetical protein
MLKILFCMMLMGFIFAILMPLIDGLVAKLHNTNIFKIWWRKHICDYEEDYIKRRQETISEGKNYKYWLKIRKAKKTKK